MEEKNSTRMGFSPRAWIFPLSILKLFFQTHSSVIDCLILVIHSVVKQHFKKVVMLFKRNFEVNNLQQ
jgi:hypothetical protein